jgi:hypothetical protein
MKHLLLCSLLATGLLAAKTHPRMSYEETGTPRLSANERIALETSSPRVHVGNKQKGTRAGYRVAKDKHTINAFVPVGK